MSNYHHIQDLRECLFSLDKNAQVDVTNQKKYSFRIKNLTQAQRQLIQDLFNNPNLQFSTSQINNLHAALTVRDGDKAQNPTAKSRDRKELSIHRKKWLPAKIMRALKNHFGHRIKSSKIKALIHQNRVVEYTARANFKVLIKASLTKTNFNSKIKLITQSSRPLDLKILTIFLNLHRNELFKLAFDNPENWNSFIKNIQGKLLKLPFNRGKEIFDLFTRLERYRIHLLIKDKEQKRMSLPKEIVNQMLPYLSKDNLEVSLHAMRLLSKNFNPELIANFIKHHNIPLNHLTLSPKELRMVANCLDNNFNLSTIGVHYQNKSLTIVNYSAEYLKYLELFKNIENLYIGVKDLQTFDFVKCFPDLRYISCCSPIADKDLQIFGLLPKLSILRLLNTIQPQNYFTANGILFLKNVINLELETSIDLKESLGNLTQLKHLQLTMLKGLKISRLCPNLESLSLTGLGNKSIPSSFFNTLRSVSSLEKLTLITADLSNKRLQKQIQELNLKSLTLINCSNEDHLKHCPYLINLTELNIE